jgi:hypothetical protein
MTKEEHSEIKRDFETALEKLKNICNIMQKPTGQCPHLCPLSYAGGCLRRTGIETLARFTVLNWGVVDNHKKTCKNCIDYHEDIKTHAVFCSNFNTFMDSCEPCAAFTGADDEDPTPKVKPVEHPKSPAQEGMTCRDCAMCEEMEPDTWYCAQYGSLMDDANMQPCMHFIFDSELKKEMFSDESLIHKD